MVAPAKVKEVGHRGSGPRVVARARSSVIGLAFFFGRLLSDALCAIGVHDWRNGPGYPCSLCGKPDRFWIDRDWDHE